MVMTSELKALPPQSAVIVVVLVCAVLMVAPLASAQVTPVPKFVSGQASISLTNQSFEGRTTVVALTSPSSSYELVLIQDGFGEDKKYQYCWTEVHDTSTGQNLTWRAPCNPLKVDACSLVLTSDGDFQLDVEVNGVKAVPFTSGTGGEGVVDVQLTDQGDLLLVKADNTTVWQSSDHLQRQAKCKEPFNSSHRLESGSFLAYIILLSVAISFNLIF